MVGNLNLFGLKAIVGGFMEESIESDIACGDEVGGGGRRE